MPINQHDSTLCKYSGLTPFWTDVNYLEKSSHTTHKVTMKNTLVSSVPIGLLIASILFGGDKVLADTITLKTTFGGDLPRSQSYTVPSNVVAQILFTDIVNASVRVGFPQTTNVVYLGADRTPPVVFVGPATITLTNTSNSGSLCICTIQTTSASTSNFTPSSSVVIPNDNGGPVTIILESSTDLITWTAANPGTYGTTSSNRFFRVRAQR